MESMEIQCKKCGTTEGIKEYIPYRFDGSYPKCSLWLCEKDLKKLQKKHSEIRYIHWTKAREVSGEFDKDVNRLVNGKDNEIPNEIRLLTPKNEDG